MLAILERHALQLKPYRWTLFAASIACVSAVFATIAWLPNSFVLALRIALPTLMWAWGLLCLSAWFAPDGTFSFASRFSRLLPKPVARFARWYAAVFIIVWLSVALVVSVMTAIRLTD